MPDQPRARLVICRPAKLSSVFADDVPGTCSLCQQPVQFRPHIPARRVLICLECFIIHAVPGAQCELLDEAGDELEAVGFRIEKC